MTAQYPQNRAVTHFLVTRSTSVDADPGRIHALIDDFHRWVDWSPWEGLDSRLERTYSGPASGVGAHYAWKGNRKAGEGWMEITASTPERIDLELAFMRPFDSTQQVSFLLAPTPRGTGAEVTWQMSGEQKGLMALMGRVVSMDRLVGKDFDKGLARLKSVAEGG
jgi:hypothetical protein